MTRHHPILALGLALALLPALLSCSAVGTGQEAQLPSAIEEQALSAPAKPRPAEPIQEAGLPVRYLRPAYVTRDNESKKDELATEADRVVIRVGADISSAQGPVPLRDIMKRLAALKSMNVSWASDVDQYALVDVDIRAEDDFFTAVDNLLRQQDYFHEVQGNTLVIKYKETRKFHIAMPFLASTYDSGVGGDVLGSSGKTGSMTGAIRLTSEGNTFDVWDNVKTNLDQILQIWTEEAPAAAPAPVAAPPTPGQAPAAAAPAAPAAPSPRPSGKGYYSIDKPIGLITVTAPRPLVEKVATYLDSLKAELYRQVAIEAKIVEVTLDSTDKTGIDWSELLDGFNVTLTFGGAGGQIYPNQGVGGRLVSGVSIGPDSSFTAFLNALQEQGQTRVIANPRLSVLNGQPSLISVGDNVTFIDKVTKSTSSDTGEVTFTVSTSSVMSGLGLAVTATILDDQEVILSMTPVTSQLTLPIEYRTFGGDSEVGLPQVRLREMATTVRVRSGEMLVVGGLIDSSDDDDESKVPVLGDLPLVDKLFKVETEVKTRRELIILLRPRIIS
ncbi:MAG: pilus (MSHA type) biogenesis protein MshL [Thermodesulfobacteriota bacterium]